MKKLFKFLDITIGYTNRIIAVVGISLGVLLAFTNVVARYAFDYSITWAAELTVYLFLWSIFFGTAYCFKLDGHIAITILIEKVKKSTSKKLIMLTRIINFIFLIAVAYFGYEYLLLVNDLEEVSVDLQIPMWIPYLVIPISFTFAAYRVLEHIVTLYNTPPEDIELTTETSDILKEAKIDKLLDEVHVKTGGML